MPDPVSPVSDELVERFAIAYAAYDYDARRGILVEYPRVRAGLAAVLAAATPAPEPPPRTRDFYQRVLDFTARRYEGGDESGADPDVLAYCDGDGGLMNALSDLIAAAAPAAEPDAGIRRAVEHYVRSVLSVTYKPEGVDIWLHANNRHLKGATAMDMLNRGEFAPVVEAAERIEGLPPAAAVPAVDEPTPQQEAHYDCPECRGVCALNCDHGCEPTPQHEGWCRYHDALGCASQPRMEPNYNPWAEPTPQQEA